MKNTNRYIALALCFTLTLGAFAYRPPQAEAVVGVDDAVVIGALLSAFAGGCGLIFSNNGMTSSELAQGLTDKWNEFNEAAESGASSFAAWLGFEDTSALLGALSFSGGKLAIPRAIAQKFAEFTTWLVDNLGVTADGDSQTVVNHPATDSFILPNGNTFYLSDCIFSNIEGKGVYLTGLTPASSFNLSDFENNRLYLTSDVYFILEQTTKDIHLQLASPVGLSYNTGFTYYLYDLSKPFYLGRGINGRLCVVFETALDGSYFKQGYFYNGYELNFMSGESYTLSDLFTISQSPATDLSASAPAGVQTPDLADDEAANPTLSGVGDGTATSIEELLQKILEQLQANTLAPTLDLAGTEIGGDTGTDEDSKPYLPYIPQIFEKIKDLPGTLSNILETAKGIPAAIAEKIGAFFTTLWGWLSDIITEIKALPAAIAEKVKALFVPHEGYAAEFVADITATYQGRMGLLTYPFTVLADFVGTVATLEEQEPILRWDAVEWQNKTVIAAGEYSLKSAVSSTQMQTAYTIYKTVVSGVLVVAFLHLCYRKLKEVQHN